MSVLVFLLLVKGLTPVVFDYCICIMIPIEFHFLYRIRNPTFSEVSVCEQTRRSALFGYDKMIESQVYQLRIKFIYRHLVPEGIDDDRISFILRIEYAEI